MKSRFVNSRTGAHGSTIKYNSSISSQVVKMTVVDGRGNVIEISDPTDLKAFKINLGLLGIYSSSLFRIYKYFY